MHDESPNSRRGRHPDESSESAFDTLGLSELFDPTREIPVVESSSQAPAPADERAFPWLPEDHELQSHFDPQPPDPPVGPPRPHGPTLPGSAAGGAALADTAPPSPVSPPSFIVPPPGAAFGGLVPNTTPFATDRDRSAAGADVPAASTPDDKELWTRPRWDPARQTPEFTAPDHYEPIQVPLSGSLAGLARTEPGQFPETADGKGMPAADSSDDVKHPGLPWLSSDTAATAIAASAQSTSFIWFGDDRSAGVRNVDGRSVDDHGAPDDRTRPLDAPVPTTPPAPLDREADNQEADATDFFATAFGSTSAERAPRADAQDAVFDDRVSLDDDTAVTGRRGQHRSSTPMRARDLAPDTTEGSGAEAAGGFGALAAFAAADAASNRDGDAPATAYSSPATGRGAAGLSAAGHGATDHRATGSASAGHGASGGVGSAGIGSGGVGSAGVGGISSGAARGSGSGASGNSAFGNSRSGNSRSGNSRSGNSRSGNSSSGNNGSGNNGSGNNGSGSRGSGGSSSGRGGPGGGAGGAGGGGPFAGILAWIRNHPRTSLIAAVTAGVVLLGGLSFGLGAATSPASAQAIGVPTTSTPSPKPTVRPTPTTMPAASKVRTCSVASFAADPGFGTLEAQVRNASTGQVLYDRNGANPAPTASVLKMLTAAAAFSILGPNYRVPTIVVKGSQPGQVVVIGGGDVTLSRLPSGQQSFYTNAPHLDDLASQVRRAWNADPATAGKPITSLVVDTSLYSGPVWLPSWDEHEERIVEGSTPYMTSFMADGDRDDPTAVESPRSSDPVGRAAQALADDLGGNVAISQGKAPAGAQQLGEVQSQPVSVLAEQALTYSDNTIMEELARLVAIKTGAGNSFSAINAGILKGLATYGIPTTGLYFADGSGLSADNKVPASYLTQFLIKVLNRQGSLGMIYDGLPIAGQTGTLGPGYDRFGGSYSSRAVGHVNAKTGWINTSRTLAGVIHAQDGTNLTFAIYALNYGGDNAALNAIDNLTTAFYVCGNNLSNY